MKNVNKPKDDERVSVNYEKIVARASKTTIPIAQLSRLIGRSPAYINTMRNNGSKMLYSDLKKIAKILDIHGATKLIADKKSETNNIDEDVLADIIADAPADERIAMALEEIARLLSVIAEKR